MLMLAALAALTFNITPSVSSTAYAQATDIPTDTWAVRLAPGADPAQAAARLGMQLVGPVANLPGYYLLRAPGLSGAQTLAPALTSALQASPDVLLAEQQVLRTYDKRNSLPVDPFFDQQWQLHNTGQFGATPGNDINVLPAWAQGYTGTGVVIGIVDDGPEYTHPDLAANWRADLSYDYYDNDNDPAPIFDQPVSGEAHGTSVAGIAAAAANATCGVGVAYNADIAGLRLVVGGITDAQIASALAHRLDALAVSNNSWGPPDNGTAWGGVGQLALDALAHGATTGRDGKGVVYVWAGGNGGRFDHTGADGFINSRYTLAVAASTSEGRHAPYSELGAGLLVNAPSNGGISDTVTTDRMGPPGYDLFNTGVFEGVTDCTNGFGGTSSAAPLVAGTVALMLQANPALTWRDVQAILAETATQNDPTDPDWAVNGAGYSISHKHGFGRVNAEAAVARALTWELLGPESRLSTGQRVVSQVIPDDNPQGAVATVTVRREMRIESVELVLNVRHARRGDLRVELTAPSGTKSILLMPRRLDNSAAGIRAYPLLSLRHFGESALGTWTVRVIDTRINNTGVLESFTLNFYGEAGDAAQDYVVNGDFEADPPGTRIPTGWRASGLTQGDRLRQNTQTQRFAASGQYAFQMVGRAGKNTRLRQDITPTDLDAGDTLILSAQVRTQNLTTGGRLRLRITYTDDTVETLILPVPRGTGPYTLLADSIVLPRPVKALRLLVMFANPRAGGRFWVDDVRVEKVTPLGGLPPLRERERWLPLPPAPPDLPPLGQTTGDVQP